MWYSVNSAIKMSWCSNLNCSYCVPMRSQDQLLRSFVVCCGICKYCGVNGHTTQCTLVLYLWLVFWLKANETEISAALWAHKAWYGFTYFLLYMHVYYNAKSTDWTLKLQDRMPSGQM